MTKQTIVQHNEWLGVTKYTHAGISLGKPAAYISNLNQYTHVGTSRTFNRSTRFPLFVYMVKIGSFEDGALMMMEAMSHPLILNKLYQ